MYRVLRRAANPLAEALAPAAAATTCLAVPGPAPAAWLQSSPARASSTSSLPTPTPTRSSRRTSTTPTSPKRGCSHFASLGIWGVSSDDCMDKQYEDAKVFLESKKLPPDVDPLDVFSNAELNLSDIEVYGFDYDYTLATYKTEAENYIYDCAKKVLVHDFKYPEVLLDLKYDSRTSIRGLHYDIEKGLLLKIDSINQIQMGSVHRGRSRLSEEEVLQVYKRRRLPQDYVEATNKMVQLVDIFAKPLGALLSEVVQWFLDNEINYVPLSIFADVRESINRAHPLFHSHVVREPQRFLDPNENLLNYLQRLKSHDKKIFLITNSPFDLVNSGMSVLVGRDWRQIFDIVIINAKKPNFFTHQARHFRKYLPEERIVSWKQVNELKPGNIYSRGNITDMQELTQWTGDQVLYFGDHPYADLADLSLNHGWRTGAIIKELEEEICLANTTKVKWNTNWAVILQHLILENQKVRRNKTNGDKATLRKWQEELAEVRETLKGSCNTSFGSIFRTHHNSTFFSRRLFRFADIYTSRMTNLNSFSLDHHFIPRRGALPHEFRSWYD